MATKQEADRHNFSFFDLPSPKQHSGGDVENVIS